ncbi:type VI secretion system-associated FHA domain protein [Vibrio atlanticus]|uniref:FHA domain protein n=1 Tax=Vibrio atlanticus TaxID=693153 RepID=A0A1C3IJ76_9VIBR|nr:FHA domain-containing protein [Vibrio atlanticus]SBS61419.1 FHA domain protein [Vibrio atlanticus]
MPLSIRIISSPDGESIAEWNQAFPEDGGDIGRAFGNTLQLSDASREISGTHAIIRKNSRGYQIADNSTNGLFINGSDKPLGNGNQSTLSDGDVLDIGRYRLLVSCFVPDLAVVKSGLGAERHSPFGDDPFSQETPIVGEIPTEEVGEPEVVISTLDVVDDDPFVAHAPTLQLAAASLDLEFQSADEDPLVEAEVRAIFPPSEVSAARHPELGTSVRPTAYVLAELQHHDQRSQDRTDKALEMALTRLLSDISPTAMENMFDELSGNGFWSRKPKYWEMYKHYFHRQVDNRDWQVKFQAYFREALRLQRNLEGEK